MDTFMCFPESSCALYEVCSYGGTSLRGGWPWRVSTSMSPLWR